MIVCTCFISVLTYIFYRFSFLSVLQMSRFVSTRLLLSLLFYVLFVFILLMTKPSFLFDKDGNIIAFGVGQHKTIFSLGSVIVVFAIICFYLFAVIDLVFQKKELNI